MLQKQGKTTLYACIQKGAAIQSHRERSLDKRLFSPMAWGWPIGHQPEKDL